MRVLGIETSCDEASAAVVTDQLKVLSNVIDSQDHIHAPYGGVVPELASREHLRKIDVVVRAALDQAGVTLPEIDMFAVTRGPGLVGSLLIGVCYAKSLAYSFQRPLVGVNHLIGHMHAVFLEHGEPASPYLTLVVSGGHTSLLYTDERGETRTVGRTRDDAAGEAFDKVAKMLGLDYPGGPNVEKRAASGKASIRFSPARMSDGSLDFSFSGLKTAVLYHLRQHPPGEEAVADICASFQKACCETLAERARRALERYPARAILLCGGVACNKAVRAAITRVASDFAIPCLFPSPRLCADNGAMIAAAAIAGRGETISPLDLDADPNLRVPLAE